MSALASVKFEQGKISRVTTRGGQLKCSVRTVTNKRYKNTHPA